MPKSTKKKKDKAADFSVKLHFFLVLVLVTSQCPLQKAKLKLGKGKKLANNAIDTSYKARCESLLFLLR